LSKVDKVDEVDEVDKVHKVDKVALFHINSTVMLLVCRF